MMISHDRILLLLAAAFLYFLAFRSRRFRLARRRVSDLLDQGGVIVDVRTPAEFSLGSCEKSINIPLKELKARVGDLDPRRPVMVCCNSGTRASLAVGILKRRGFSKVLNLGSWQSVAAGGLGRRESAG